MILSVVIILLSTQSSIQQDTKQHFLFNKLTPVALPNHYVHIRIPIPFKPIINRIEESIHEFRHQRQVASKTQIGKITDHFFDTGMIALQRQKDQAQAILNQFPQLARNKRFLDIFGLFTGAAALGMSFYNAHNIQN